MADKLPNQYLQAFKNVDAAFTKHADSMNTVYPPSRAESLSTSIGTSSWQSTLAKKYADDVREIVSSMTSMWDVDHNEVLNKVRIEGQSPEIDPEGEEGWKTQFLNGVG
jgi:hypothetical protein